MRLGRSTTRQMLLNGSLYFLLSIFKKDCQVRKACGSPLPAKQSLPAGSINTASADDHQSIVRVSSIWASDFLKGDSKAIADFASKLVLPAPVWPKSNTRGLSAAMAWVAILNSLLSSCSAFFSAESFFLKGLI